MRQNYESWLIGQQYDPGTITAQMHRAGRVEKHYGDLDELYANDGLRSLVAALHYSAEDERRARPNPSKLPINGNIRNNLASYKNAIERYRRFRAGGGSPMQDEPVGTPDALTAAEASNPSMIDTEDLGARIGLERDMQATLRRAIVDLEDGLQIIDDGAERFVTSGRIDITCRDQAGTIVVIELKAGVAGQRAVGQILSYMGDVSSEEDSAVVRGLLVASGFDHKAIAAARMIPSLELVEYGVRFEFRRLSDRR